jgi:K+-transporting ATPase A subunit
VKLVLLPFALAIDIGLVPLAFAVFLLGVFLTARRSVPMTLTVVGVLFVACYPITRVSEAREQADILRALSPLASMSLDALQAPGGREFELTIPTDTQWQRIIRRVRPPSWWYRPAPPT